MAVDARKLKMAMMILLCITPRSWAGPGDDSLPPPPQAQTMHHDAVYQLALVLNHYDSGLVVPVTRRDGAFFISSADLLRAGLPPEQVPAGEVNLSTLASVRMEYDSAAQRLLLTLPRDWVTPRVIPFSGQMAQSPPATAPGRCSITISIPPTPNGLAVRPRCGMSCAISTTAGRSHRQATSGNTSPVTRVSSRGMCGMTPP